MGTQYIFLQRLKNIQNAVNNRCSEIINKESRTRIHRQAVSEPLERASQSQTIPTVSDEGVEKKGKPSLLLVRMTTALMMQIKSPPVKTRTLCSLRHGNDMTLRQQKKRPREVEY